MIRESSTYASNLRRLMARLDMTLEQVVKVSGLNERTVKGLLGGRSKPRPRTLHRLATGLGVPVDEFFWPSLGDQDIRQKIESLLQSDQRDLLIELVELVSRRSSGATG